MNGDNTAVSTPSIEIRGLEKSFGEHRALRGIDLEVKRGECLVIFGPNGAGKTTLLKIISTLLKPSVGNVILDGNDIREKSTEIRRKISLVSHHTFLYNDLTISENLKFYGKMYDVANLDTRIREVTAWAQLDPRLHDKVGTLSRGMQQRASLARAVLHNPSFLFLDEPEVGLDPHASDMVKDVLSNTDSGSRTVVITTHNLERGLELADRIVIIDRGKIAYQASGRELAGVDFRQIYDRYTGTNG
jgi:ABC-type multidrug transport system ATPase subunit